MADGWQEPGRHEVAPGVFRLPLPLPDIGLQAVNVYLFGTDAGLTLVDGGWDDEASRAALEAGLATLGHELGDVDRVLVTHAHADHYTQAVAIGRGHGADVRIGAGEAPSIARVLDDRPAAEDYHGRLVHHGAAELVPALRASGFATGSIRSSFAAPDGWLVDGEELAGPGGATLTALATPGHTRGHMVFDVPGHGAVFTGDHVLPHITPSIGFEPAPSASPLAEFLDSLARMRRLPDRRVLPAHGPVTDSLHARVDELLAHHRDRLATMHAAVADGGAGGSTPHDVARRVPWTRRGRAFAELDVFNQMLAVNETAAHLEVLAARGQVAVVRGEVLVFAPVDGP